MTGEPETLTPPWAYYRRTGLSEMRPYVPGEDLTGISVSQPDLERMTIDAAQGRNPGGYIARNPNNHNDQWYVAQAYFDENLTPATTPHRDATRLETAANHYFAAYDALTNPNNSTNVIDRLIAYTDARDALRATLTNASGDMT